MIESKFLQHAKYYKFMTKDGVDYFTIKDNAPIEAIIMAKKVNDCFVQNFGYAPVLNIDDFDIPDIQPNSKTDKRKEK